ncbi:hypothetical protein GCM10011346_43740 [Oceanobacillus neutriphilus]|uniref:DUF2207 domain-containing protein n=2 Tax=Oceanobacillus neutriphilus TaxID=531815 RepID=A0ABQ2P1E8_9BACI|nr:hypothetical protein GCM10011346_43740 [Oceanobacillus neutriphilus]
MILMKRSYIFIVFFLFLLLSACSDSDDRSFTIDKVSIDAHINENGTIDVKEVFTYNFDGIFEGTTRTIKSDLSSFRAYLANDTSIYQDTAFLDSLRVEKDDQTWKVYSDSENEMKTFIYEYVITSDSITKYQDIGEFKYAFFDASNETDLHDVTITVHTPHDSSQGMHSFLKDDAGGELMETASGIEYTNSLVEKGDTVTFRMIFPSDQLVAMGVDRDKTMESFILEEESKLSERASLLNDKTESILPFVYGGIIACLLALVILIVVRPNRYRGAKDADLIMHTVEEADPLLLHYFHGINRISVAGLNAALFSLRRQGIISVKKVQSSVEVLGKTYCYTWEDENASLQESDLFLKEWLFKEKDESGHYFRLDSLTTNHNATNKQKKANSKKVKKSYKRWRKKAYRDLKHTLKKDKHIGLLSIFALLAPVMIALLYYYHLTIQPIREGEQIILTFILLLFLGSSLLFRAKKSILSMMYLYIMFSALMLFNLDEGTIGSLFFILAVGITGLFMPFNYWSEEIKLLKFAGKQAEIMYKKKEYPVGDNENLVQKRMENAIVLKRGYWYQSKVYDNPAFQVMPEIPDAYIYTRSFDNVIHYYGDSSNSSGGSSGSSSGGGGAGAF